MAVIDEIRAERARQRMPLHVLAARAGIARPTLSRKLRGDRPLTVDELEAVADVLRVPAWLLVQRADLNRPAETAG